MATSNRNRPKVGGGTAPRPESHAEPADTPRPTRPKPIGILVLGMHRSGTSALTRTMNLLGAKLPDELLEPSVNNPLGHWESRRVYDLQNGMLEGLDTSWDDWTPINEEWFGSPTSEKFAHDLAAFLIEEFAEIPLFVLKDPRMCRVVPLWRRAFDIAGMDLRCVIPVRNPLEVARSLAKRNEMPASKATLVWLRHLLEAETQTRDIPRSIVKYEALLSDWKSVSQQMATDLGLRWPRWTMAAEREIEGFLSPEHRHHVATDDEVMAASSVPEWAGSAYGAILRLCDGEQTSAQTALDHTRTSLDKACAAFWPLLSDQMERLQARADAQRHAIKKERGEALLQLEQATGEIETLRRDLESAGTRLGQTTDSLRDRSDEVQRLSGELASKDEELLALRLRSAELAEDVARWREAAKTVAEEVGQKAKAALKQADAQQNDNRRLQERHALALEELSHGRDELIELRRTYAELAAREDGLSVQLEAALAASAREQAIRGKIERAYGDKIKQLKAELKEEREKVSGLKDRVRSFKDQRSTISAEFEALKRTRDAELAELEAREADSAAFKEDAVRANLEVAKLRNTVHNLEAARDRLLNSPSWRLSKPIRQFNAWRQRLNGGKAGE